MPTQNTCHRFLARVTNASYGTLFFTWVLVVLGFGILYFTLSTSGNGLHGLSYTEGATKLAHFLHAIYFSVITATTVGYGDITPQGFSKGLAGAEAIVSFLVLGIFIAKLVGFRQEIVLQRIHRMAFEEVYHRIRGGLFIMRKDFDILIREALKRGELSRHSWENLTIAYRDGQTLLREIPNFYDLEHHLYTIDEAREHLLLEAVERTLSRLNHMLDVFSEKNIAWADHAESIRALKTLTHLVGETAPLWQGKSPYIHRESFEDILLLNKGLHRKMEKTVA